MTETGSILLTAGNNLNKHNAASFYEAFIPEITYHLTQKFEFHYTPKHEIG